MKTIEEKAKEICGGNFIAFNKEFSAALEMAEWMEQNPSDALIMRILNCIGYEDESWIEFVRKELEKRKEKGEIIYELQRMQALS